MKHLGLCLIAILSLFSSQKVFSQQPSAQEIINNAYKLTLGDKSHIVANMTIIRPDTTKHLAFEGWYEDEENALIYIKEPASEAGTRFLKVQDSIWEFHQKLFQLKSIDSRDYNNSWMGSDFSFNDILKNNNLRFNYTFTFLENVQYLGFDCYQIKLDPKPEIFSVWTSVIMYISTQENMILSAKFYKWDGQPIKELNVLSVEDFDFRTLPQKIEMVNMEKKGFKSILSLESVRFHDIRFKKDFFTVKSFEKFIP
ncbi:outer membrane lipoprotein-sorting protein [Aureibacter tunicatorum]|uniref:Uncharacterized protein TP-0789 domain-containing protein n=1 Tax=Aureibacter tunicatorum TaxID=866807 RepID=A0AAE4BR03_9BACT|nr:outer membrane lipoprotein-sorting protein [Aureibacter tunicatorum]MDR6239724.1 hypothetical protein [Aureibacter tunicatorum]BDD04200.1 outer membrane lipoprotein-sorting protein [Aureibacter tunicatorum]